MSGIFVRSVPSKNAYYFYRFDGLETAQQIGVKHDNEHFVKRQYGRKYKAYRDQASILLHRFSVRQRRIMSIEYYMNHFNRLVRDGSIDLEDRELFEEFKQIKEQLS
jgi:hypothetical protein